MQDNKQQPKRSEDMPEQPKKTWKGEGMAPGAWREWPVTSTEELCRQLKEIFSQITPEEREQMKRERAWLEEIGALGWPHDEED